MTATERTATTMVVRMARVRSEAALAHPLDVEAMEAAARPEMNEHITNATRISPLMGAAGTAVG